MQLISQYFTLQLVWISQFANISYIQYSLAALSDIQQVATVISNQLNHLASQFPNLNHLYTVIIL